MTKKTKLPIEFEEADDCEEGQRMFFSTNLDPWRIFIEFEDGDIRLVSVYSPRSCVMLRADERLEVHTTEPRERYIATTAEEVIDNHWVKNALRTIWKAVR